MAGTRSRRLATLRGGVPMVGELFSIVREMSFDDLREEALLPPRLLLAGADQALLEHLRDALGGGNASDCIDLATFEELPTGGGGYDGIVLVNPSASDHRLPAVSNLLTGPETAGLTLTFILPPLLKSTGQTPPASLVNDLRNRIVNRLSHRQLALGRHLPPFRQPVANAIINQTARANAEFALLSNLPALIPVIGNVMAAGADFLVLTKNQLMMLYKLAAVHGRDLEPPWRLYTEMLPVVGAGLVWRTVARELTSLIPFAAGTIPKVLIAYAGTTVAGQSATFFYEEGRRPSRAQLRHFYERAVEAAQRLPLPRRKDDRKAIEADFTTRDNTPAPTPGEYPGFPQPAPREISTTNGASEPASPASQQTAREQS